MKSKSRPAVLQTRVQNFQPFVFSYLTFPSFANCKKIAFGNRILQKFNNKDI